MAANRHLCKSVTSVESKEVTSLKMLHSPTSRSRNHNLQRGGGGGMIHITDKGKKKAEKRDILTVAAESSNGYEGTV